MHAPAPRHRLLLATVLPVLAQGGAVAFKHFHRYPASGQWSTEGFATLGGKPWGAPVTSTACASPITAARRDAIMKMGNDAAPQCKINILRDEETTAEYEQVCTFPKTTIHSTMHAVDDKTITEEIRQPAPDGSEMVTHSTSRFLGPCTAAQAAEAEAASAAPLPSMTLSAEDCASFADARKNAEEGLKGCDTADYPEAQRATCKSTMAGALQQVKSMEQRCAR